MNMYTTILSNRTSTAVKTFMRSQLASFLTLSLLLLTSGYVYAEVLTGQVVSVSDGYTITVLDESKTQHKIRLAGIDAPEKVQPFGQASKKSLSELIYQKQVSVSWEKTDRYKRIVGKVSLQDQDICLEQVKRGMAWHYKQYQRYQTQEDRLKYDRAEREARDNRIGLWSDDTPIEPSKFRHAK